MTREYYVFERIDLFGKNKGMRAACFLENGRFFTNHGHESNDFSVKNRKKGYPIDFFSP